MRTRMVVFLAFAALVAVGSAYGQTPKLLALVRAGTPQQVQAAIDEGAEVNVDGGAPLKIAAEFNPNPEVITVLLKAGADIDPMGDAYSLIIAAAKNPNPKVLTVLVKAGADIEARSPDSMMTPLMYAAWQQNPEMITALLEAGADVNAANKTGWTPLMLAEAPKVIAILLKAGADVNARDLNGETVAAVAAEFKNPEVFTTLLKLGDNLEADTNSITPLMDAAMRNRVDVLIALLNAGAKIEAQDYHGWTPLMLAGTPEVTTVLLKAGANLTARDGDGRTALMLAAEFKSPEMITVLLKAGADVEARDTNGMTPLMYAAGNNKNPDVINRLLKAGADAKARDNQGQTAFDYAQQNASLNETNVYRKLQEASQ